MVEVIRKKVVVEAGGKVQLEQTGLTEGAVAELVVLVDDNPSKRRARDLFGSGKGGFNSPEDATRFIRQEREAWGE